MAGEQSGGATVEPDDELEIDLGGEGGSDEGGDGGDEGGKAPAEDRRASAAHANVDDDDETPEQRRERRKQERAQSRQFRQQQTQREAELIATLTETVRKQSEQLSEVNGRLADMETGRVVQARDHWVRQARHLRALYAKAIENGEGERAVELQTAFNNAEYNARYFHAAIEERQSLAQQRQPAQPQPVQQQPQTDAVAAAVQRNGMYFMSKHSWYDANGADRDSQLVKRLDAAVMKDGYNPATKEYWVELERRMHEAGLIEDDEVEGGAPTRTAPRNEPPRNERGQFTKAGGPPVGGRAEGGKVKVTVPKFLKDSMIEAGQWDDPVVRKRVVTEYFKRTAAQERR